nr:gasdermin-A isoform X1 [Pelodiscus sinensis]|eukprot:XP_014426123.1 gasdermin-A isoform X1 [Pelodiscus sinensis]
MDSPALEVFLWRVVVFKRYVPVQSQLVGLELKVHQAAARMFYKVTKQLVKQLVPDGDLLPVCNLIDQDHFRPLCLVRRKPKKAFCRTLHYAKTGFRLWDILVPGEDSTHLDVQDSGPITVVDCVDGTLKGSVKVPVDFGRMEAMGAASTYQVKSIKMKKVHVSPANLELLKKERKINMNSSFIKQLRESRENLYVIYEAVQALEETTFFKSNTTEGSILNEIYVHFSLKGTRGSKRAIIIPKDCVLAYRILPLIIADESWDLSYHPGGKTFVADGATEEYDYSYDGGIDDLKTEVENKCAELSQLSTDLRAKFLKSIIAVIIDSDLLQELKFKLEEAFEDADKCELKSDNPDLEDLLNNLQDSAGSINLFLVDPVLYTLHALEELTEDQLLRLAQSVEKKIVPKQLELVKSILKQEASSLDANIISSLQEEELNITKAMIEMDGVKLQRNGLYPIKTGDMAAFAAFSALYVALYALHLLSRSE